jgi:putative DNA primase/helicase
MMAKTNLAPQTKATRSSIHLTDTGNGKIFAHRHGQDVRFCHDSKKWLMWDDRRWVPDRTGEINRRAKETAIHMMHSATRLKDVDRQHSLVKHALKSQYESRIRAMIALAQSEPGISVTEADLDSDQWLLNVQNGTLNLKTGQLGQHRREALLTNLAPVEYDKKALCPIWDKFLADIMGGDNDLIRFLQKTIGYSLTGSTREQVFFILFGTGANGKSTFINTIHKLLGSYALQTATQTILTKQGTSIPNDVARLKGARFVSAVETEFGKQLAESLVKQLTGGDKMTARFLYGEYFEFHPTFKLFLAANHKPVIKGSDHAIWRRIRLVPFNVTIPTQKQNKNLVDDLSAELPGILRWAVEGCMLWQSEGLEPPDSVKGATGDYQSEMDVIGDFIAECCVIVPDAKTPFKDLFSKYSLWSSKNGDDFPDQKEFARGLAERGFTAGKNGALGRYRSGIRLK